jgi:SAM-dependent methyltransferase
MVIEQKQSWPQSGWPGEKGAMADKQKTAGEVARYYDFIYLWTQLTNRFRAFDKPAPHTIHRPLMDPATGQFETEVVHRLIAAAIEDLKPITGLDAGCGYGGTAMELSKALGGQWHGVTINKHQVRLAARNAQALGFADKVSFTLGSYDAPLSQKFNVIYGIESLIHSPNPAVTIANLTSALQPGGRLVIVDDMPDPQISSNWATDLAAFKTCWHCPVMPTATEWTQMLHGGGCKILQTRDLTDWMRPRSEPEVVEGLAEAYKRRRWMAPLGMRLVTDAQIGGLHLERLTRERAVRYVMIIAEKT